MGDGHHGWAAADFLSFVRNMLVREVGEVGEVGALGSAEPALALCSMISDEWSGKGIEVHDAPTHFGKVSFAVRWHGDRPALLWEVEPHEGIEDIRLTTPGLDADWSSSERQGEALLAPMPAREATG
jgi:hypothetical protein